MFRHNTVSGVLLLLLAVLLSGAKGAQPLSGQALEEGLTVEREIRGGETHSYPVDLQEGQFLRVTVQEKGIDLVVRMVDPNDKVLTGSDRPAHLDCQEDLAAIAVSPGRHRLEVSASPKKPAGNYRLVVQASRISAKDEDRIQAEAAKAFWWAFNSSQKEEIEPTLHYLEHAQELWTRLRKPRRQAETLFMLANKRKLLEEGAERAAGEFQRSALLWEGETDAEAKIWRAKALNSAGYLLKQLRRTEQARELLTQAVAAANAAKLPDLEAASLNNLGLLEVEQGELQKGIANLLLAQERDREAGTSNPGSFINTGYAYELLGERQKAIQSYQEALELSRSSSPPQRGREAAALNNLGDTYYLLGDMEAALSYFQQALEILPPLKDRRSEAKTRNNLGAVYVRLGRFQEADAVLNEARRLSQEERDTETEALTLIHKAESLLRRGRPAEALEIGRLAVSLASGFWAAEADARQILGVAYRELGNLDAAREELARAVSLARARRDINREAYYTLGLARTDRTGKDLQSALSRVQAATSMIESVRARVANPELKAMFLASKQDYYELQIDILMSLHAGRPQAGFAAEALAVSEQARARSLLEILQESEADIREGVPSSLLEKEKRLREEVNAREWRRLDLLDRESPGAKALMEAEKRLEEAREEYSKVQDELRANSPSYSALTQPHPLKVSEIQEQLLDRRALLLEYKLGKDRSFLWAVSADSVKSFQLEGREKIEQVARRWYELLTVRNKRLPGESIPVWKKRIQQADVDADQVARELSELVLRPVEGLLGDRPLLVVAEGALQYVPFAALRLPSNGALLVEQNEVISLPSASALAVLRRERSARPRAPMLLAVLADPVFQKDDERLSPSIPATSTNLASSSRGEAGIDLSSLRRLPYSLKEAQAISSLAAKDQTLLATGFDATREAALSPKLGLYRNVHFATHGVLDSRRPELSGLVLSLYDQKGRQQDGFLRLNDIYNLHLEADLVVLSACQTALGKEIRGEGLVSLTRGFMYAGAARVLASLWSVEDRATADLMSELYRGILRQELSPSAALQKAQLKMARDPNHKSPYYWAGFSLQGEWK